MVDRFTQTRFYTQEKRNIFFPPNPVICRTCHKPRVKHRLDLNDFSALHQNMICMSGRPHGGGAGGEGAGAGAGGGAGAGVGPGAGGGVGPGHLPHAAPHGHGAHPNYVTLFEFRLLRALVNIRLTALQNFNNQIQQQMQQINQNIQNMNNQMQQQMQQINQNMNNQIQQLGQQIQNQINTVEQRLNRLERH